jgi:hypothetical protein
MIACFISHLYETIIEFPAAGLAMNQPLCSSAPHLARATLGENVMQANDLARKHFDAAMQEAKKQPLDADAVARALLGLVVHQYLQSRSVKDVQSELQFVAENCDPDTDYVFMRP